MEYSLLQLSDLITFTAFFPLSFFIQDEEVTRYYVIGSQDGKNITFFSVGMMSETHIGENYFSLSGGIPVLGLTRILDQEGYHECLIDKELFEDKFNSDLEFIFSRVPIKNESQVFCLP
jgi:hypothetical protein